MLEDWGYQLSCYDEPGIYTPNVDLMAVEGIRYTYSFCTSPVCSPSRSAMMTGFYQNYIGANQHRTGAQFGMPKKALTPGIKPITHWLKDAGYFTVIMKSEKTDLNFTWEGDLFQGKDWKDRAEGQPFFAQITLDKTHRIWQRDTQRSISTDSVLLPPYYPQTELAKRDWANGLEAMQIVDRQVGKILKRLDDDGLTENTIVFLIGDNGRCMPRGKQFLYDGGIQVPIIVKWPEHIEGGRVDSTLVTTIDISKTILDPAGVTPGIELHGKNLFGEELTKREFVFAARDKMDSTYDAIRCVRSKEFKLIHNLMPERPYLQYNWYKEAFYPVLAQMNVMHLKGELNEDQTPFMAAVKPEFELYDVINDPYELNNLAENPEYASIKALYLEKLMDWREEMNDQGVSEEFRKGGWPTTYPTRSLEQWEDRLEKFYPWVFREPAAEVKHPKNIYKWVKDEMPDWL